MVTIAIENMRTSYWSAPTNMINFVVWNLVYYPRMVKEYLSTAFKSSWSLHDQGDARTGDVEDIVYETDWKSAQPFANKVMRRKPMHQFMKNESNEKQHYIHER